MNAGVERLTLLPLRAPRRVALAALLAAAAAAIALSQLQLQLDVTELIPSPAAQTLRTVGEVFGINERAYLLLEADEPGREHDLLRCAEALGARLEGRPEVARVEWSLPLGRDEVIDRLLLPAGLLYQEPGELEALLSPAGLRARLERTLDRLSLLGLGEADAWAERDPLDLNRALARRAATLRGVLAVSTEQDAYLSADGRALLVAVEGSYGGAGTLGQARRLVDATDAALREVLRLPFAAGLHVAGTGGPYISAESERSIARDVRRSFGASLVLALLFLSFALRLRPHAVLALLVPTLWGTLVGAGLYALLRGSVAALSLGCSAVLVGLGIDFTVHLTTLALAGRAAGLPPRASVSSALRRTRGALVLAAATSGAAFVTFLGTEAQVLRDMGTLTACGLFACLLGALAILPLLLPCRCVAGGTAPRAPRPLGAVALARFALEHPALALGSAALACALAVVALALRPLAFETDLRRLQSANSPSIATQARLEHYFGKTSEGLVVLLRGKDPQAVVAACHALEPTLAELRASGALRARASLAGLLPPREEQERCLSLLRARGAARLRAELAAALEEVGFDSEALAGYVEGFARAAELPGPLGPEDLERMGLGPLVGRFLHRGPAGTTHALVQLDLAEGHDAAEALDAVVARLEASLRELPRGVEGSLGGLPLVSRDASRVASRDFFRVAGWTAALVVLVLALRFRRPRLVALVLVPACLGTLWTAGLFACLGWHLNLMNLGVLPMVLALGVDDGIHVVHRAELPGTPLLALFRDTGAGIVLTSLTTMVTFGSLGLSENPGIASVGALCFFGLGACLLATLLVLPPLLHARRAAP